MKILVDTLETMPQKQGLDPDVYRRVDITADPGKIGLFTIRTIIGSPIGDAVLLGESNG